MLMLAVITFVVVFMFACDYVFDGDKVFHVDPVQHSECSLRPFTTVQQLVLSK